MAKTKPADDEDHAPEQKKSGGAVYLIVGIAAGGLLLLLCCGGVGIGGYFVFRGAAAPDIVGRWEADEIAKLILDFRPDGTGTIEVPLVKVRIPITYKLQGNDLTIAPAPGHALGFGERETVERMERTRVSRFGDQLRMEALAGPGMGQAMLLKKIR